MLRCRFAAESLLGSYVWKYTYGERRVGLEKGSPWAVMQLQQRFQPRTVHCPSELAHLKASRKGFIFFKFFYSIPSVVIGYNLPVVRQFSATEGDFRGGTNTAARRMDPWDLKGRAGGCNSIHYLIKPNSEAWFDCPVALGREGDCSTKSGRELMQSTSKYLLQL